MSLPDATRAYHSDPQYRARVRDWGDRGGRFPEPPAQPESKSARPESLREFEHALHRKLGFSRTQAKLLASRGWEAGEP